MKKIEKKLWPEYFKKEKIDKYVFQIIGFK